MTDFVSSTTSVARSLPVLFAVIADTIVFLVRVWRLFLSMALMMMSGFLRHLSIVVTRQKLVEWLVSPVDH